MTKTRSQKMAVTQSARGVAGQGQAGGLIGWAFATLLAGAVGELAAFALWFAVLLGGIWLFVQYSPFALVLSWPQTPAPEAIPEATDEFEEVDPDEIEPY